MLIAPNPDSRPRMIVPNTVRRDKVVAMMLDVGRAEGSGIISRKNKKRPTGMKLRNTRKTDGRCLERSPELL